MSELVSGTRHEGTDNPSVVPEVTATTSTTNTGQHRAVIIGDTPPPIRVVRAGVPKVRAWSVLVLIVAALVSFLAVSQLRGPDRFRQQLGTESEGDLACILASLSSESTELQQELGSLKVELANLRNSSRVQGNAAAEASAEVNSLEVLAGTVPVTGPGLSLVVEDANGQVTYDALVDAVQELRDAGAEALAVNGRRVGVSSAFGSEEGRVTLDRRPLSSPYTVDAIGPAATMEGGLKIPGGTLDTLQAIAGVRVDLHRSNSLNMPALEQPPAFRAPPVR